MIVEILTVGDELLSGMVVNSNAAYLAKELKGKGFNCRYITTVGDIKEDIIDALRKALSRSNIVLVTGGLGPTTDDLTMDAIGTAFGLELEYHPEITGQIQRIFKSMNLTMPETNKKQAYIPPGSQILHNNSGTAPGIFWDVSEKLQTNDPKVIMVLPGVPREMVNMWELYADTCLKKYSLTTLYDCLINFAGIGESSLVELLGEIMDSKNPYVLPYANKFQVQLRVYAQDANLQIAKNKVLEKIREIEYLAGDYIYGYNEETLESAVAKLLFEHKKTIALAESCTGGLVSHRLTDIPGSSYYTIFNAVAYANNAKIKELGVKEKTLNNYGAVSEEVAIQMAQGIRLKADADIGVSLTGIAGPSGGTPEKPAGTVFIAIDSQSGTECYKRNVNPELSRTHIKWAFSQHSLILLRKHLLTK